MLEGVVFSNWKTIDTIPKEAKLLGIGLDFGYTNDPTAIIEIYNYNGQRIVNELAYQTGLLNSDIAKLLPKHVPVYADSSEPKSIDEIKRFGVTIKGVTKVRVMHDNLPSWLKGNIEADNKLSLKFKNGSQIKAVSSATTGARSEALSLLIIILILLTTLVLKQV